MKSRDALKTREITVFAMLGAVMFITKFIMEGLPGIHLLGLFITATTVVYRSKALFPIYTFVILDGIREGFSIWWVPYLYIWLFFWGTVMLLPKKMPQRVAVPVYMVVSGLNGLLFGTLFAPMQALSYGLSFDATLAWIAAGIGFDITQCIGNFFAALLVLPLTHVLKIAKKRF